MTDAEKIRDLERRVEALEAIVERAGLAGWVKLTQAASLVGISETTLRTQCRESEKQRRINGKPLLKYGSHYRKNGSHYQIHIGNYQKWMEIPGDRQ